VTAAVATAELDGLVIREAGAVELGFVISMWKNQHRRSRDGYMSIANYRKIHEPTIRELLADQSTWIVAAYRGERLIGWLAYTAGKLPAVHFAYVRPEERRRGVFDAMLDKAMIGRRFVYTYRGALPKPGGGRSKTGVDEKVVEALARRGVYAAFVSVDQWLEKKR
jgi:hypothetical protein